MALTDVFTLLDKFGADRVFRRLDPPGPAVDVTVKAMQRNAQEMPLMGDVSQEDTLLFVRRSALGAAGFPIPVVKGDRVIGSGGQVHVVKSVNELHDGSGDVGGYRLVCRGH